MRVVDYGLTKETVFKVAHDLKRSGKKICFTHGAFDLFHYGHLYMLRKSAAKCDYLIVGIDCDKNVSDYKNIDRPVIGERERLEIISSLGCVDMAFIMRDPVKEETYKDLYKNMSPSFISYGNRFNYGDHIQKLGHDLGFGVKVFKDNIRSTSSIIKSIINRHR